MLAALLLASQPGAPCTLRDTGNDGPFWTGNGWAFAVTRSWEGASPPPLWLVEYDPRGALLDARALPLEVVEGWPAVLAVEPDRSYWLEVACGGEAALDEPLCDQLAHVDAGGAVRSRWRLPRERFQEGAEPWSFVRGQVAESRLTLQQLDPTTSDALLPPREIGLPPGIGPASRGNSPFRSGRSAPLWTLGPDGGVALVQSDGDTVRVAVIAADGGVRYDRRIPMASPHLLLAENDATFRLGMPRLAALAPDGSLALTAWRLHGDCSRDREPGFVVLDSAGRLRADVKTDHHPEGLAIAPDGELALLAGTRALVHDLDGRELARFEVRPSTWDEQDRRLAERANSVSPGDDPAEWIAVYSAAPEQLRSQLDAWLVAAWPRSEPHLPDSHWQRLGARLCAEHPDTARATALRRFEESRGSAKAAWLGVLVDCFREPPPGALDFATALAERRDGRHRRLAQRAFDAWGAPFERLQATVEEMLARPFSGAGREVALQFELLAPLLDENLRSEGDARRVAARGLLVGWLSEPDELFAPEQRPLLEAARRRLAERAARWAADRDPFAARTGRLALLATGARPASELLPGLLAAAREDADLARHLSGALGTGPTDEELDQLGDDLLAATLALVDDDPANSASVGYWSGGPRGAEHRLLGRLGARGRDLLWQRGTAADAAWEARRRLLENLASDPVGWGEASLRATLEATWLSRWSPADVSQVHFGLATLGFLRAVVATAEDHDAAMGQASLRESPRYPSRPSLAEVAARRFRELFLGTAASLPEQQRSVALQRLFSPSALLPSLLSTLEPADAAQLVEESQASLSDWLWLVAETGGWLAIEHELVALLADPGSAFAAARGLSALRHAAALDVLVERGLVMTRTPPVEAFAAFGAAARDRLLPLLEHRDPDVRGAVTRVLRSLDPTPELVERLAAEAAAAFERGEIPDVETVLLLDEAGRDVFPALLAAAAPASRGVENRLASRGYYRASGEIARRLGRWALSSSSAELRAQAFAFLRALSPLGDPTQLAWSRHVEASLPPASTP